MLLAMWLAGVTLLSIRLAFGWLAARRLSSQGRAAGAGTQAVAERIRVALRIRALVRVVESAHVAVPSVIGALKPVVLLPAAAISGLSPEQIEALVAHELAHVRRHDYLVNLFQCVVETVLFYHPAVWLVSRQVRRDRELCCDDLALLVCADRVTYASALADLELMRAIPAPALAATGGSSFWRAANRGALLARVRRILGADQERAASGRVRAVAGLVILTTLALLASVQAVRVRASQSGVGEVDASRAERSRTPAPISSNPQWSQTPPSQGVAGRVQGGVPADVKRGAPEGVPILIGANDDPALRLQPDFDITVRVTSNGKPVKQFAGQPLRVAADGTALLPMIGRYKVAGLTLREAASSIRTELIFRKLLADPDVDVRAKMELVAAEATAEAAPESIQAPAGPAITVGQLIRLEVTVGVVRQMEFNKEYTVQPDGNIQVPYVGATRAAGISAVELQNVIATQLNAKGTLPGATVVASIEGRSSSESVWVLGEVNAPGPHPWREGLTASQLISLSGGSKATANIERAHLQALEAPLKTTDLVAPGSTIIVPPFVNLTVTMQGAIRSPGNISLREDRNTISDALAAAGGFQASAGSRIVLKRKGNPDAVYLRQDVTAGRTAGVKLEIGDTIIVEAAPHFYVTGYVKSSTSEFNWEEGLTVEKAIAMAGGISAEGAANRVNITRKDPSGKFVKVKLDADVMATPVRPNDVINIPKKRM